MKFNNEQLLDILKLRDKKNTQKTIAELFGVGVTTINDFLNKRTYGSFWENYEIDNNLDEVDIEEIIKDSSDIQLVKVSKQLRTSQRTMNLLRRQMRGIHDGRSVLDEIMSGIEEATKGFNNRDTIKLNYQPSQEAKEATLEVLFSDLQIGKVSRYYNTEIAKKAVRTYCLGILKDIYQKDHVYNVEKIVFAMIGDVVEDHLKHGPQSSISTDTGLAEQMHDAIEVVWESLLQPLCALNIPLSVICVTGNHGSSQHKGMDSFKAGRFSYDYVIHKTLKRYCELSGYDHVDFSIPDGTFGHTSIYGKIAVYEHGYHNNFSEKGMTDQMLKRGQQLQKHVTYWRQGDKHHHTTFGQGEQVLNGAFFGIDQEGLEYSGILGFNSIPSQTIMYHVNDNKLGRCNIKDIINIQVGHTNTT